MSTQQTAPTSYIEINSTRYAYRVIGPPTPQPPLLLLNHYRSTLDLWDPAVINPLASTRQVITYDYAGIGHSSGSAAPTITGMGQGVISFLTAFLALQSNLTSVDLLGFSIGGFVAQQVVLDAPDLINKLVLSGTVPSGQHGVDVQVEYPQIAAGPVVDVALLEKIMGAPTASSKTAIDAWYERIYERKESLPANETFEDFTPQGPALQALNEAISSWNADAGPSSRLGLVGKETLVTAGHDDVLTPVPNGFRLSQLIGGAHFLSFGDSGHGHLFQWAELYTRQVIDFLDGKWTQTGGN